MYIAGFLVISLLAGCLAGPLSINDVDFFDHTNPDARVVGGTPAAEGSVPYMVALTISQHVRSYFCGGSLLSARTVLTAAHCIDAGLISNGTLASSLEVIVGTNRWKSGGQSYKASRTIKHEQYDFYMLRNDIGLIITTADVVFSVVVQPVTPGIKFVGGGVAARAAGWGRIRHEGLLSEVLLELKMTTVEGQQCVREVAEKAASLHTQAPPVEPRVQLCAINSINHGMCNGDSGSALVRIDNGQQVGVVSWGIPCARGAPDMFARVSTYARWIRKNMV